jgi:hypothetical protein
LLASHSLLPSPSLAVCACEYVCCVNTTDEKKRDEEKKEIDVWENKIEF